MYYILYHYQNKIHDKTRKKWRCRWLGIDVDCHNEYFTPENMKSLSESCDVLISNSKKFFLFDNPKYIIKERSAHGYHLFIIFKKDILQEKALFYRNIIFNKINQFFKERHDFVDAIETFPANLIETKQKKEIENIIDKRIKYLKKIKTTD